MTTREFIQTVGTYPLALLAVFTLIPLLTWLLGVLHGRGRGGASPWKYGYAILVYLACVPGIFAGVLTAYSLLFVHENLVDVNPLVYFLPIASAVVTLALMRKRVSFAAVPGFDRLSGLMALIACSFALALLIEKTRIWVMFFGSIWTLFLLVGVIFAVLKWGTYVLFRQRDEPARDMPKFPGR